MNSILHIGDADGLIALVSKRDANHTKAKELIQKTTAQKEKILFPATAITEAITTLQVRLKNPTLAKEVAEQVAASALLIIPISSEILKLAVQFYDPTGSRKNTMFDATVAATAKWQGTQTIFSFDKWYPKVGFSLLSERL